ncbi:MAG: tetratricopeptide (TPR) repeat protein, partial [Kiritimatiellia bacterium]
EDRMERNASSIGSMLGELRTSMSDILFLKTERYLHGGVAYTPHINKKVLSVSGTQSEMFAHQKGVGPGDSEALVMESDSEKGTETIIPTASEDFRGFIGQLHRDVKPWLDPTKHAGHADGKEVLPWFRVMTLSDPHYVRAYSVGAWWLKTKNLDAAFEFIREGIKNNPNSFQVHAALGDLHYTKGMQISPNIFKPEPAAIEQLLLARDAFQKAADLAIKQRPPKVDPKNMPEHWSTYLEDDTRAAINMAVLLEREFGTEAKTRELAARYLTVYPEDPTLKSAMEKATSSQPEAGF